MRRLLQKVIAAFPNASGHTRAVDLQPTGDSLEAELAGLGPIQSVTFIGFVSHGVASDGLDPLGARILSRSEAAHWEAYDVEQTRGSSVWLVSTTGGGAIRRIEVAME